MVLIAIVRTSQEQRIAVGRRTHDRLGSDVSAGARPVLDNELLAKPLGEPLTHQAREMSAVLPAPKPTIRRTGRDGHV